MGNSMGGSVSKQRENNKTSFAKRMTSGMLEIRETMLYGLYLLFNDHTFEDWQGMPPYKTFEDKEKIEKTLEELRTSKTGTGKKEIILSGGEKITVFTNISLL